MLVPAPAFQHEQGWRVGDGSLGEEGGGAGALPPTCWASVPPDHRVRVLAQLTQVPYEFGQAVMAAVPNHIHFFPLLSFVFSLFISFTSSYTGIFPPN